MIPSSTLAPTRTFDAFTRRQTTKELMRDFARDTALRFLATGRDIAATSGWIRFPFYHHVFEDERAGFERQLRYLSGIGEFISLSDAVTLLESGQPIDGRYFCITFDDGLDSCAWGAAPILNALEIAAAFFVVTDLVGQRFAPDDPMARSTFGFKGDGTSLDFMSWDDIKGMADAGFEIGSHSASHAMLSKLDADGVRTQMTVSKAALEDALGRPCIHFCPPYGVPGTHFLPQRDADIAKALGYVSFSTGARGPNCAGADPFQLRRDHMLANWGLHQMRYFLSMD